MTFNQGLEQSIQKGGQGNPALLFESKSSACLINKLTFYMDL